MGKQFIILSSCGWGYMLQRPHHLARSLVKLGNIVHFIEAGPDRLDVEKLPADDNCLESCFKNSRLIDRINIYTSINIFHQGYFSYNNTQQLVQELMKNYNGENVIVTYFPSHIHTVNRLSGEFKVIYDCVDDHTDLEHSYWSSKSDLVDELHLLDRADVVLTTSSSLFLWKGLNRNNVYLSMNGVNVEDFSNETWPVTELEDLKDIPKPRIGYVGAVYSWFDKELFFELVRKNPDKSFVVIGPVDNNVLDQVYPNLFVLGTKKHGQLKNYLRNMDVGIIPFKDNIDLIINCNPIKMYEYLACELPVVATRLPDLCLNKGYIKTSSDFEGFNQGIAEFIKNFPDLTGVVEFVQENTWRNRAKGLVDILDKITHSDYNYENYKKSIVESFRTDWELALKKNMHPILQAMYALTYYQEEPTKFLKLAEEAYNQSQSEYTFKTYILALYINGQVDQGIREILSNSTVSDLEKAELIWANSMGIEELVWIKLFYSSRCYPLIKEAITKINNPEVEKYERANFYFLVGKEHDAKGLYKLLEKELANQQNRIQKGILMSPLFNARLNLALVDSYATFNNSRKYFLRSIELMDQYLNRESRVSRWQGLFSQNSKCDLCGSVRYKKLIERPDKQKIVICANCGLGVLNKLPKPENLEVIQKMAFSKEFGIAETDYNPFKVDLDFLYEPRIKWIEQTNLSKLGLSRKLLDIGCGNGQFLEMAKNHGWEVTGVETSSEGYIEAVKRGIEVHNCSVKEKNFNSETFDCITLWDNLNKFISPLNELTELYRILKPNGQVYITTINLLKGLRVGESWYGYNASFENLYYFEPNLLIKMLNKVGFKVDQCFSHERGDWEMNNISNKGHILLISAHK